jgi:hypothetical protein
LLIANLAACLLRTARVQLAVRGRKRWLVGIHVGILLIGIGGGLSAWRREVSFYQLVSGERLEFPQARTSVEMKGFAIEFYPGTDQPQEFRTTVSVTSAGRPPQETSIRVNHPLSVGGYSLYQASFEVVGKARIRVQQADTVLWEGWLQRGEAKALPGQESWTDKLEAFQPDAVFSSATGVQSRSYRLQNPGVCIGLYENGGLRERLWWNADGLLEPATPRFQLRIEQADLVYATILKTVSDPGFPLVGAGFALVSIAGAGYLWRQGQEATAAISKRGESCGV